MAWLTKLFEHFQGAKTYIVGAAAILTAVGAHLNGALSTQDMVTAIFTAIGTMTIRHGISTTSVKK